MLVFVTILSCYAILSCLVFIKFKRNYNNFKKYINENQLMLMKNEKIIYIREIEQNCRNHFLVKLEDESIVVYNVVDDSTRLVYKKINEI